jgi:alpha-amylase
MRRLAVTVMTLALGFGAVAHAAENCAAPRSFADNPIVYFVMTDRFANGDPANDRAYGRAPDGEQEIGTFHGGDLAGLTARIRDGWFRALGVNALWITAPYEQIHGWVVGGDRAFRHYGYHGYYALDYTRVDANLGDADDLRRFVDTAHEHGLRVLFDVVMNHPGYGDLRTLNRYGVDVLWDGWRAATLEDYHSWIDYNDPDWADWWGPAWVRADLAGGYRTGPSWDERLAQLAYLPDFRTEATEPVALPPLLQNKWRQEGRLQAEREALAAWFEATGRTPTVRNHLIKWLTDWVRDYGIDGFRVDTAKHVEMDAWAELKEVATAALAQWKRDNPERAIDQAPFWMTGEVWGHGVERSAYYDHGFDSVINFDFQDRAGGDTDALEATYARYARTLRRDGIDVLSYLSSHDTRLFDRDRLIDGGTALLLAPGGVQIYYGDETARPPGPAPASDPQQATRSDMNWDSIDAAVLDHWRRLGHFRARHPALARGRHRQLSESPYVFARVTGTDRVIAAVDVPPGPVRIPVGDVFADGSRVRDGYTGAIYRVEDGAVAVTAAPRGVVLLAEVCGEAPH